MYTLDTKLENDVLSSNELFIDSTGHQVKLGQTEIELTLTEFGLLLLLMRKKGKVVSRTELLQKLWGSDKGINGRTLDVHICRLRKDRIKPTPARTLGLNKRAWIQAEGMSIVTSCNKINVNVTWA